MTLPTNEVFGASAERCRSRPEPGPTAPAATGNPSKLAANYYNSVAASIFAVGALAPLVALALGQAAVPGKGWVAALAVSAFALSLVVDLAARYLLRRELRR